MTDRSPVRVAFMCVQNAGRSQMATAFAERERDNRGLDDQIEILTGGTQPADSVHEGVIEAMVEEGIDISDRTPREITTEEVASCDYIATMGVHTGKGGTDPAFRWDIEWARHLATDTPSDVERFDEFLEYLATVGFADEPHELR